MILQLIDNPTGAFTGYNKINKLIIEPKDPKPFCKICGQPILNNDYCWYSKTHKIFNCSNCVYETEIDGITTGEFLPSVHHTFNLINTTPVLLVDQDV